MKKTKRYERVKRYSKRSTAALGLLQQILKLKYADAPEYNVPLQTMLVDFFDQSGLVIKSLARPRLVNWLSQLAREDRCLRNIGDYTYVGMYQYRSAAELRSIRFELDFINSFAWPQLIMKARYQSQSAFHLVRDEPRYFVDVPEADYMVLGSYAFSFLYDESHRLLYPADPKTGRFSFSTPVAGIW